MRSKLYVSPHNNATLKHTPVRNWAPQTARSSSLRSVLAAEHQTAEQYSKTGRTKPQKHLPRIVLSWNTRQDFLKIPSLWEAALETERRCFQEVILESNVSPNITRSSDYFTTVLPIVNGGEWGYIVWDLEPITVLVLLTFNFISQRSHHSLTLQRSRIRDSATTLMPRDAQQPSKWSHQHNWSAYFPKWKNAPKCTGETLTGPKHCPAAFLIHHYPVYSDNHPL